MNQALNTIAGLLSGHADAIAFSWGNLRYPQIAAVRSKLATVYSPATANKMLCALRGVLREAWRLNLVPESDYRLAVDVKRIPGVALPAGRALTVGEIEAMLCVCLAEGSELGVRDAAVIAILYTCGLRRSEVCALDLTDYDGREMTLRVRRAKGARDRSLPIAAGATKFIKDWLTVRGENPGALFVPVGRHSDRAGMQLSTQAIYNILRKRAAQAGVQSVSPHDLRRTLITHLLARGVDLVTVSRIAGHASVTTTARYDRRGEEAKHEAIQLIALQQHH
jgi:site-specific recombinase XerD